MVYASSYIIARSSCYVNRRRTQEKGTRIYARVRTRDARGRRCPRDARRCPRDARRRRPGTYGRHHGHARGRYLSWPRRAYVTLTTAPVALTTAPVAFTEIVGYSKKAVGHQIREVGPPAFRGVTLYYSHVPEHPAPGGPKHPAEQRVPRPAGLYAGVADAYIGGTCNGGEVGLLAYIPGVAGRWASNMFPCSCTGPVAPREQHRGSAEPGAGFSGRCAPHHGPHGVCYISIWHGSCVMYAHTCMYAHTVISQRPRTTRHVRYVRVSDVHIGRSREGG